MIIDVLKEKFPNIPSLRVRDIAVSKANKRVNCTVVCDISQVDADTKKQIEQCVKSLVPKGFNGYVSLKDDVISENTFRQTLADMVSRRFPMLANLKRDRIIVKKQGKDVNVTFVADKVMKSVMDVIDFKGEVLSFCNAYTSHNVTVEICEDEGSSVGGLEEQERLVQLAINRELLKPSRYFDVTDVTHYIGKMINSRPMYISDVREPKPSCVICGKIYEKSIKPSKNNPTLQVCKFTLKDESGSQIDCILFARFQLEDKETIKTATGKTDEEVKTISEKNRLANEKQLKKLMELYDTTEVIVRGKVVKSNYSGSLEMQVCDICKCRISAKEAEIESKPAPASYVMLTPEVHEEFRQLSLDGRGRTIPGLLRKSYVMINVNATGFNVASDKIYAISAVKIKNGVISEKIFSYVNPEMPLTAQQLARAKASVGQLVLNHTLTEIISDVFKFCYGSILVSMNVAEIVKMLNYYAAPLGYRFQNETVKQNDLFSDLFDLSAISHKANCSRLADVCKSCRVQYDGSEFCGDVSDAAAKCVVFLGDAYR